MACINQSTQVYSTPSYCYWEGERRRVSVGRQYLHRVVCWKDGSKSSGKGRVGMMYRMRGPISGHAMVIRKLEAVSQPLLNINYIMREVDVFFPKFMHPSKLRCLHPLLLIVTKSPVQPTETESPWKYWAMEHLFGDGKFMSEPWSPTTNLNVGFRRQL
jgi:hypothetical protein